MPEQLKNMSVDEFVTKLMSGERYFAGIRLPEGANLAGHGGYGALLEYLNAANFSEQDHVVLDGSELNGLKAQKVYLPFLRGKEANLGGAYLSAADLWRGDLG